MRLRVTIQSTRQRFYTRQCIPTTTLPVSRVVVGESLLGLGTRCFVHFILYTCTYTCVLYVLRTRTEYFQ